MENMDGMEFFHSVELLQLFHIILKLMPDKFLSFFPILKDAQLLEYEEHQWHQHLQNILEHQNLPARDFVQPSYRFHPVVYL